MLFVSSGVTALLLGLTYWFGHCWDSTHPHWAAI